MEELFRDMQSKGLISFEPTWLQRAIIQKSHNLTLGLAHSTPLPLIQQDDLSEIMCLVLPFETTTLNWN